MPRPSRLFLLIVVTAAALFAQSTGAFAAPTEWKFIDVTMLSEQGESALLVAGELPPDVQLPYEAQLAVPAGTQLQWIGEILGGDPANDPELEYTKTTADGMDVYTFTLTQSRIAQVEGAIPSATAFDGVNYRTAFQWTAWQDVPEVRVSQRLPKSARVVQGEADASLQAGGPQYNYYTKTVTDIQAGETVGLAFGYSASPAAATNVEETRDSGFESIISSIIFLTAAGALGLLAYKMNAKMKARRDGSEPAVEPVVPEAASPSKVKSEREQAAAVQEQAENETEVEPGQQKKNLLVPVIVVVGIILVSAFIVTRGASPKVVNGVITKNYGSTSACQSSSIRLVPVQGVDLAAEGERIIGVFEGIEGIGIVTLDAGQSKIDVEWCDSHISEQAIHEALLSSGLVTLASGQPSPGSVPATATLDASD